MTLQAVLCDLILAYLAGASAGLLSGFLGCCMIRDNRFSSDRSMRNTLGCIIGIFLSAVLGVLKTGIIFYFVCTAVGATVGFMICNAYVDRTGALNDKVGLIKSATGILTFIFLLLMGSGILTFGCLVSCAASGERIVMGLAGVFLSFSALIGYKKCAM